LADKHQITLFSFIREDKERQYLPELKKYCAKILVFKRRPAWNWRNIFLAGFSFFPFVMIATYLSLAFRWAIAKELKEKDYDLIHAEPFYMMPNIPKTKIPILLVEQTIEYLVYKKYADNFPWQILKPFMYFDVLKLKFWEKYYWRQAAGLVAMSKEDKLIMGKAISNRTINVVANGVDIDFFMKTKIKRLAKPTILFVGNFKWLPNKDAALFLTNKIWPKIKKAIPQAKLWIVGRNPTKRILSLARRKDVQVDGGIEDIRECFGKASVLLAPIRNGRGTKYKVLEAMAAKLPIVSTSLGVDGIAVKPEKDVLVANKVEDLAKQTIRILSRPVLGEKIAASAFLLVKKEYNWQKIAFDLDKLYKKASKLNSSNI